MNSLLVLILIAAPYAVAIPVGAWACGGCGEKFSYWVAGGSLASIMASFAVRSVMP